jgi:hypothetical protein
MYPQLPPSVATLHHLVPSDTRIPSVALRCNDQECKKERETESGAACTAATRPNKQLQAQYQGWTMSNGTWAQSSQKDPRGVLSHPVGP